MKNYILVDDDKIVRCIASEEANLHKNKLHMKKFHVKIKGTVGDEYDEDTDEWVARPQNYPKPTKKMIERIITNLIRKRSDLENMVAELDIDRQDEIDDINDKIADWKEKYDEAESTNTKEEVK